MNINNSSLANFQYYRNILGAKIFVYFSLTILVSLLDGIGLTMFVPLLQTVGSSDSVSGESMGQLHVLVDFFTFLGLTLNLNSVLVILALLFVLKGAFKYIQLTYQVKMRMYFMKKVRYRLVDGLYGLSYPGFLTMDAGRIQNVLVTEVQRLFNGMTAYFNAAQSVVMLVTYVVLAFLSNYQFALMVAVGSGLANILYRRLYKATTKASKDLSAKGSNFNSYLIQAIHHFKYLKATDYFATFSVRLKNIIDKTERINYQIGSYTNISLSLKEPMIIIIVVAVIAIQANVVGAPLTSIMASLLLLYRGMAALLTVQGHWQNSMQNSGAMYSVQDFEKQIGSYQEDDKGRPEFSFKNAITLRNASFSYNEGRNILSGIDIEIEKNTSVAFIGESGSGKTTLANIISGLIYPTSGEFFLDDSKLRELNIAAYRKKIGYISQESVIFNDNIYNNVTFWAEPTPEIISRFWKAIELASLKDFINNLPEKENTMLGDNGLLVSGGQKQRISIARELYKDAEILIMDEATSALDSETERLIQENIDNLHGKYTMIIVAHRLSTIRNVDTIYLLEKGQVTASGNFSDMLDKSSKFKKMVALQEF